MILADSTLSHWLELVRAHRLEGLTCPLPQAIEALLVDRNWIERLTPSECEDDGDCLEARYELTATGLWVLGMRHGAAQGSDRSRGRAAGTDGAPPSVEGSAVASQPLMARE